MSAPKNVIWWHPVEHGDKPPRSPSDLGQNIMHPMYHTTRRLLAPKTFPNPRPREHVNSLDVPTFSLENCELGHAFLQSHRISTPTTNVPTSAIHIGTPPIATNRPRLASNASKRLSVRLCTISEHYTTTRYVGMTTRRVENDELSLSGSDFISKMEMDTL